MAEISLNVEFDLTIHSPGIVPRFLAWVEANKEYDEVGGGPVTGRCDHPQVYDPERVDAYEALGLWLVGVANPKLFPFPGEAENTLYVHIFPNIPMQVFGESFGEFLKALGVDEPKERTGLQK